MYVFHRPPTPTRVYESLGGGILATTDAAIDCVCHCDELGDVSNRYNGRRVRYFSYLKSVGT